MSNALETEEVAARWLVKREGGEWSNADQADLDTWLNASPENTVAFWRLEYGWEKADRVASLGEHPQLLPEPRRNLAMLRSWRPVALAASILIAVGLGAALIGSQDLLGHKVYRTAVGGHQTIPLADGSKIELNTATKVRTVVGDKGREIWLDQGEAYFEVKHDPNRPFIVHVGERVITDLGTKFSVRLDGDRVQLAVVEGRVNFDAAHSKSQPPTVVTPGDIVIAEGNSTLVTANSVDRVADDLSWRQGRLSFDQVTLADAVAEFNRYNQKKLIVTDPHAASLRIGGSFEAENVDAFARLLQRGFGLKVEDDGYSIKISS